MRTRNLMHVLLVVGLLVTTIFFVVPQTGLANKPGPNPSGSEGHGFDSLKNKGVLIGLQPGVIIAHFVVQGTNTPLFDEMGRPNGVSMGDIVGPADGKPVQVELSVSSNTDPNSMIQNRLFVWTAERGYELLSSLTVTSAGVETKIWVDNPPIDAVY